MAHIGGVWRVAALAAALTANAATAALSRMAAWQRNI